MITRRRFLERSALAAAAGASLPHPALAHALQTAPSRPANLTPGNPTPANLTPANLTIDKLARFVDPLPILETSRPAGKRPSPGPTRTPVPFHRIAMRETHAKLHRDLPPARLWSFGAGALAPVIEARSGQGLLVEWANQLPATHFLPIDHTLHGAEKDKPAVRSVVHLHGGKTPADSDGWPEDWYLPGKSRTYFYPNQQDATLLWYHDHAMGINRLNIYAGLLGLYIVRDHAEDALRLPSGKYEIPLMLFDRDIREDGQLDYPVSPNPEKPWVPEVFGAFILANGKAFPYLDVEPRKYRFRVLNGSNGRFYRLSLPRGVDIFQIGTDQGLLPAPVKTEHVLLAPGERADLVIDFAPHKGERMELKSDAFEIMQFRVAAQTVTDTSQLPATLRAVPRLKESDAVKTRRLTLDETMNDVAESMGMLLNKTPWHMPITENPRLNTTEIWELVNLTDDVHPIHLHLVRFQILDRRRFDGFTYMTANQLHYFGDAMAPEPNELGWKDTVRVNAKTVTRIIVPFTGYSGRYVWHCHILEHEDNEMMRPYEVLPA